MFGTKPLSRRAILGGALTLGVGASFVRADEQVMSFPELYESFGVMGLSFSSRAKALKGKTVTMAGYMAPPLRAESPFFVLTREPLAICPFCQSDADWPVDIVVVYLAAASPLLMAGAKLSVTGVLELGSWVDPDSGFVSQVRLRDSRFRKV